MYRNFESILEQKGLKPYDVSKGTGIATSTLTDWKKGRTTPKADKLKKIADFLGVSIEKLMGSDNLELDNDTHTWDIKDSYYEDKEAAELANFAKDNKEYQVLFDACKNVKPESIEKVLQMIKLMSDQ